MADIYRGVTVVCYAGYRGEQEPRRFSFVGRDFEVVEIVDRWLDPRHRYFKVTADDEGTYLLRHDVASGEWEVRILLYGKDPGV